MADTTKTWMSFKIGDETYVHKVSQIKEVIVYQPPVETPGAGPDVLGMINIRGEVMEVVGGCSLTGSTLVEDIGEPSHILIVETANGKLGVCIDAVGGVQQINDNDIEPTDADHKEIVGTWQHNDKLFIAVDFTGSKLTD